MIIDFHVHAFPDALAARAIRALESEAPGIKARLDGRVSSLLESMDRAGIDRAVLCSIATKAEQFDAILQWSRQIASARIIPFPSVHPKDPQAPEKIRRIAAHGFKGIKLHPYYQDFDMAAEGMYPLYECMAEAHLLVTCHTGFDIAFPRVRRCDPERIATVLARVPRLKLITTHLGGWEDWNEARRWLLGKPVYMDLSTSLDLLPPDEARRFLAEHPAEHLLFGSDSPWDDQAGAVARLRSFHLPPERETAILGGNAARLLS